MGKIWRGFVWAVGRNTEAGKKMLGEETLLEQHAREAKMGRLARVAYQNSLAQKGRDVQYEDEDCVVKVKMGYSRRYACYTTDIVIAPRDGSGDRYHVIIDEHGNELYSGYHKK